MNRYGVSVLVAIGVSVLLFSESAFAGPGGYIAKTVYETFWGKVAIAGLLILFAPVIVYNYIKTRFAERRARKDLRFIAAYNSNFDWLKIRQRVKDCFIRVHGGWRDEDLSGVSDWMTTWYWQNQQQVFLDKWREEGLVNVCEVKRIRSIYPVLFVHRNEGAAHEGSMVVVYVRAEMKDYLAERASGNIVEGSNRYKEVTTIWTFTMEAGAWKVADIEQGFMLQSYVKIKKELPAIESTLTSDIRA